MRTAAAGRALLKHPHVGTVLQRIQRTGEADDTAAKDQYITMGSIHRAIVAVSQPPLTAARAGQAAPGAGKNFLQDWYLRRPQDRRTLVSRL
ncbi:hypothetical protein GCM10007863_04470 [Dyella mobilis]|nr:hypothetical protein GCM10007863_04470 [Dyella mobilis]